LVIAAASHVLAREAPQKEKMNALLVYGKDFLFGVTEPDGWVGDTGGQAARRQVNIVFFPKNKLSKSNKVEIRIRVNSKVDENTIEDLNADIAGYRKKFPNLQLEDLPVEHPKYKTFPKLLFVSGSFYEYVTYLNPGPESRLMFSIALSKTGSRASDAELRAFEEILKSLSLLSAPGFKVIK
jgi:hypothetical protein